MGRDHLQDLNMDGRNKLKMDLKEGCEGVDWIQVAQDRVKWLALVTTTNC
jgi:hypothetical protein